MIRSVDINFKANKDDLTIKGVMFDREIYTLVCINLLHFYTVCLVIEKMKAGEEVDESFFRVLN